MRLSASAPLSTSATTAVPVARCRTSGAIWGSRDPSIDIFCHPDLFLALVAPLDRLLDRLLTPTESDLLARECAILHPPLLKHLRDEIREPYFLDLKRFLWKGVFEREKDREGGKLKGRKGAARRTARVGS